MSFRQIFDRISQLARATVMNDYNLGGTYQEALRRAEELIEEARRKEEGGRQDQSANNSYRSASGGDADGSLTYEEACRIIGIPVHATRAEITAAYRRKIVRFHPDRTHNQSPEQQKEAMAQTQQLNQAYTFLKKHAVG